MTEHNGATVPLLAEWEVELVAGPGDVREQRDRLAAEVLQLRHQAADVESLRASLESVKANLDGVAAQRETLRRRIREIFGDLVSEGEMDRDVANDYLADLGVDKLQTRVKVLLRLDVEVELDVTDLASGGMPDEWEILADLDPCVDFFASISEVGETHVLNTEVRSVEDAD